MCSINGCSWRDAELVKRMNALTAHRGPDGTGVFEDASVTLGANRLAIIDLSSSAAQPMRSADGRYTIAFNGEIYNYRELRAELSGYPFKSESDTEVILAGFSRWGTDIFARLNGIFALALWNHGTGVLTLARDRMGVKPLYFHRSLRGVLFSSEAKALLAYADMPRTLNRAALPSYLRLGCVPGGQTMFEGVEKLPPGHFAALSGSTWTITSFVSTSGEPRELRGAAAEEALRETIDAAVKRQLVSDRPLGVYLSGGLDSSIILDSMSHVHPSIDTYSVGFDVPRGGGEWEKFNADFLLARRTAKVYGTRHHEGMMGTEDLPKLFEDATYYLDEPTGNSTALAQLFLSRFAKETVTVVLCGDGGDELFGGYDRYRLIRMMDLYQRTTPAPLRSVLGAIPQLRKLNATRAGEAYALAHFIKDDVLREIAPFAVTMDLQRAADADFAEYRNEKFPDAFMRLDRTWGLVADALMRTDKMTMAAGVEGRVPLLDNEVVALADRMPLSEKVGFLETKRIVRRAFRGRLPSYLLDQPKRGWFTPAAKWLRAPRMSAFAREVLSGDYAEATRDVFDWEKVRRILEDHIDGRRYNLQMIFTLMALQVWARRYSVRP